MPISCGNSVLTGTSGSVAITPAGTSVCLRDYSDFPAGQPATITVPAGHGFLVGDQVEFTQEDGGNIDGALSVAPVAYVISARTDTTVEVRLASAPDTDITLAGDGGTGTGDRPLPAHINMSMTEFQMVCNVTSFELNMDREQLSTTSLSCDPCGGSDGRAPFKTYQPGFIDGTGSIEVQFDDSQSSISSRLLNSSLAKDQSGAQIRLYINTVCSNGAIDNNQSGYIEAPVTILGFSFSVSPEEVTTATVNFALAGQPTAFRL